MELATEAEDDVALGLAAVDLAGVMCLGSGTGTICNGQVKQVWNVAVEAMNRLEKWNMKLTVVGESTMCIYVEEHLKNTCDKTDDEIYPFNPDHKQDMSLDLGQSFSDAKACMKEVKGQLKCDVCEWRNTSASAEKKAFKRCGGCKNRVYCSTVCQKKDWKKGGHKVDCKKYQNVKKEKIKSGVVDGAQDKAMEKAWLETAKKRMADKNKE